MSEFYTHSLYIIYIYYTIHKHVYKYNAYTPIIIFWGAVTKSHSMFCCVLLFSTAFPYNDLGLGRAFLKAAIFNVTLLL